MSQFVWAPHDTYVWDVAQVLSSSADSVSVKYVSDQQTRHLPLRLQQLEPAQQDMLRHDADNLCDLQTYTEGIILHSVRRRFLRGSIYTLVGSILIAVNPYKPLDVYGVDQMERCLAAAKKNAIVPHIYSIAAVALLNMRNDGKDQSILISG